MSTGIVLVILTILSPFFVGRKIDVIALVRLVDLCICGVKLIYLLGV